ncbi:MAG: 4-alpha-glucanotransferase [Phycisphaerae bacterium]|nr:4-alpha-glucanotransferase [Phycisphaerae bacterium]
MAVNGGEGARSMRILMLGWEFPPFKAGGLGTACFGLTKALDRAGHEVIFVLPRPIGDATAEHVKLFGPDAVKPLLTEPARVVERIVVEHRTTSAPAEPTHNYVKPDPTEPAPQTERETAPGVFERTSFLGVEAGFTSPYNEGQPAAGAERDQRVSELMRQLGSDPAKLPEWSKNLPLSTAVDVLVALEAIEELGARPDTTYGSDLFGDAERYARLVSAMAQRLEFDVVHAHDWLAYPAGMAIKRKTGKPLVCHMHATEFDRSGEHINQQVYEIERAGMHAADRVVAVSELTKAIVVGRYDVPAENVDVVYNGVERDEDQPSKHARIESDDKIVLFLGRITMQKGPEYFIRAAKRALEKMDNIKFVVAGSGDMAMRMIEEAATLGIGSKVLFTGFLRGRDVPRVFRMADCYVMPSVSEPFGIAALEAMQQDTPVIISKQSGVSEVLRHALKVDFWDVDEMANKIVAVLKYPPLSQTLRTHGEMEARALTWDDAARKTVDAYRRAAD